MIRPIPCVAFRNASTKEWMEKLAEETAGRMAAACQREEPSARVS